MIIERTPDVVLLDVHMPDGGGLAVLRAVNDKDPSIRFLALSVSDAAEDVISVIRAGARGYVTKNISGSRSARRDLPHRCRRRRLLATSRRIRARRLLPRRQAPRGGRRRSRPRPVHPSRAPGACGYRARLLVSRHRDRTRHLRQDGGEPRLVGLAQTTALEPPPAVPLGVRASPH